MRKRKAGTTTSLVVRPKTTLAQLRDYDAQKELALEVMRRQTEARGRADIVSPDLFIESNELILMEDGRIIIRNRSEPLSIHDDIPGESLMVISPYRIQIGFDTPKRGKYNDVDRLFFNEYGTAELGEVKAVGVVD